MQRALTRIAHEIVERNPGAPRSLGPRRYPPSRRAFLARSACRTCSRSCSTRRFRSGDLDIGFYRDDVSRRPDAPVVHASHIDFDVDGRTVVIVDDVLYTGRTVRAAIEALFDYGRPRARAAGRARRSRPPRAADPPGLRRQEPAHLRAEHVYVRVRELDGVDEVAIGAAPLPWRPRHEPSALDRGSRPRGDRADRRRRRRASRRCPTARSRRSRRCAGRMVLNLFYEASTRTRSSFELAAKRLSADVVNFAASGSSVEKGESLKDTVLTLSAHKPDAIVLRTPWAGAAELVSQWCSAAIVNAGDGKHEHPTQALLDVYTLRAAWAGSTGPRSGSSATSRTRAWRARTSSPSSAWAPG